MGPSPNTQPCRATRLHFTAALLLATLCAITSAAGPEKSAEPTSRPEYLRQSIRLDFDEALSRSANYLQAFDIEGSLVVVKAGWYGSSKNPDLLLLADLTNRKIRGPYRTTLRPDVRRPNPLSDFVAFGPQGRTVLTGSDIELRVHHPETLHVSQRVTPQQLVPDSPYDVYLSAAAVTRDRSKLLLRVDERSRSRDPDDRQLRQRPRAPYTHFVVLSLANHAPLSRCSVRWVDGPPADLSADGRLIAYVTRVRSHEAPAAAANVFVVSAANCEVVRSWSYQAEAFDARFLPDNEHLAITFTTGTMKATVVQIAGGAERFHLPSPAETQFRKRLAVSADGAWIATTGGIYGLMRTPRLTEQLPVNRAELWSARTGSQSAIALVSYSDHTVNADSWDREIQFTSDSQYLVFPAPDWSLRFFQLPGGRK